MLARVGFVWAVTALIAAGSLIAADQAPSDALRNPAGPKEQAPATFTANFSTSAGAFVITVPEPRARRRSPHPAPCFEPAPGCCE